MTERGTQVVAGLLMALALAVLLAGFVLADGGSSSTVAPKDPTVMTNAVVRFFEERVQRDPHDFVSYNRLAGAYVQRARQTGDVADYSRAVAALEASLEALPNDNYEALVQLSLVYGAMHRFSDALALAQQALGLKPSEAFGYAVLGDAHVALGRYDEAEEAYQRVTAEAPGLSSFSRLAYLLELRGDLETAELMWRNALSTDSGRRPESTAWARVQLGNFHFNVGEIGPAEEEYERALRTFPDYVHALAGLAKVQAARADYDGAASLYELVVDRYPIPEYVAALGDVHLVAGRSDDAEKQYDLVAAIDKLYKASGINTDLQMALFFADHDLNLDEAVRQARAVYEARPSIQAADVLAWALYKSGSYEEVLEYSGEALKLGTQDATMLFHAGMIRHSIGDYEEARNYLERAIQINPGFSVLYAGTAADTLRDLQSVVRR